MNPDRMIDKVHAKRVAQKQKPKCEKCAADSEEVKIECTYCGYKHKPSKANCPAWDKQCSYCNGRNHFSRKCRKKRGNVRSMDHHNEDSDVEWLQIHGVVQDTTERRNTACMKVNDFNVRVQLDTGADYNTSICPQTLSTPVKRKTGYAERVANDANRCDNTGCDKHEDWRKPRRRICCSKEQLYMSDGIDYSTRNGPANGSWRQVRCRSKTESSEREHSPENDDP